MRKSKIVLGLFLSSLVLASAIFMFYRPLSSATSPYIILYALDIEGELLLGNMVGRREQRILGRTATRGRLADVDVVLAESGVGLTNAAMITQKLIDSFQPQGVIFTGIAGAINDDVQIGDIVVSESWATHDYVHYWADQIHPYGIRVYVPDEDKIVRKLLFPVDSSLFSLVQDIAEENIPFQKIGDRSPKLIIGGVGVSGNEFVDNSEKRIWLVKNFDALIIDRESSAVAQVCTVNGIPFIVFRSVSDLAGGSGPSSARGELEEFSDLAAINSSLLVMRLLEYLNH